MAERYRVRITGTSKRPFEVWDELGGWVVFCSSSGDSARKRAAELNAEASR